MRLDAKQAAGLRECADYLDQNWLELSAGLEGFLADEKLRGVHRHAVQWGDADSMGNSFIHMQSGRFNWFRNLADLAEPQYTQQWLDLTGPRGVGLILASIKTDYKFPMTYPDRVTVLHKLTEEPKPDSDRFDLEVVIYSENQRRPAARCFEDIVVYDYQAGKKATLKPFVVKKFRELYHLQLQRQKESEKKVAELQDIITEIEKSV
ncbi:hypothetical protein TARUN_6359 [Trichoderma arundinaceum]|uniref:Thioesterase thiol ester dehydrase-isomerase n=1 Tax=Trichoderma arundinaceum TaxID=490622 RepID=A0A395NJA1_TRIAR|nr:hypothetical protein TARUN_6359 [Trichoderma arundinaceum]